MPFEPVVVLQFGTGEVWWYIPRLSEWRELPAASWLPGAGSSGARLNGTSIYFLRGGQTPEFWVLNTDSNNMGWLRLPDAPGPVGEGGSLVGITWGNAASILGNLVATQGGGSSQVWGYEISTGAWKSLATVPATTNRPPVAVAGPDQTVVGCAFCVLSVPIDASSSSDPDGDRLKYQVYESAVPNPFSGSSTPRTSVTLVGLGEHQITVRVVDSRGAESFATVRVVVQEPTCPDVGLLQQALATANTTITGLRGDLAACEARNGLLAAQRDLIQAELNGLQATLASSLLAVDADFSQTFGAPGFRISGSTDTDRLRNLIQAILSLNRGRKQGLFEALK